MRREKRAEMKKNPVIKAPSHQGRFLELSGETLQEILLLPVGRVDVAEI